MPDNLNRQGRDGKPTSPQGSSVGGRSWQEAMPLDHQPHLNVRAVDDFIIVEILNADMIAEDESVNELGSHLQNLVEAGNIRLLLNLKGIQYASSTVLSKLAYLNRKVAENRGLLRIFGLDPELFDALRICRLDHVFEVYADESEAISVVARPTNPDLD